MERYATYTLRDFIQDEAFIGWVKYPDPESTAFWESVKEMYPEQVPIILKASGLVKSLSDYYPEVPEEAIEQVRQILLSHVGTSRTGNVRGFYRYAAAAASVVLVAGIGWWGLQPSAPSERPEQAVASVMEVDEVKNEGATIREIRLPDGSSVGLHPKSQIRVVMEGDESREVYLEGEAFFKVARDTSKPFYVFANGLVTKVLGTSFKVSACRDGEEVKVEVHTGRVQVYSGEPGNNNQEEEGLILAPNQQAVFRKKNLHLTRTLVEVPKILVSEERLQHFNYVDTPIAQIFEGLEEIYGIHVVYDEETFRGCKLNMSLSDESLFEKLELIAKVINARYNVIDGQVIFKGEGCQ